MVSTWIYCLKKRNTHSLFLNYSEVGINNWTAIPGVNANGETSPSLVVVKNATKAAADALAIKNNSTATPSASASTPGAKASNAPNAGNSLYAGLLPVAAAVAAAVVAL